jgi:hypothetical protein
MGFLQAVMFSRHWWHANLHGRLLGLIEEANCISLCVLEKTFRRSYTEGMEYATRMGINDRAKGT